MNEIRDPRIFVEWDKTANFLGAYINSLTPDFQKEFAKLVAQHGPPDKVEYREEWGHVETF